MNTINTRFFAIAAIALSCAGGAQADEADASQYAIQFASTRSAADVAAEARMPVRISNGSTGFIGVTQSGITPATVRADTLAALRAGSVSRGEGSAM